MKLEVIETAEQALNRALNKYLLRNNAESFGSVIRLVAMTPDSPLARPVWERLAAAGELGCDVEIVLGADCLRDAGVVRRCIAASAASRKVHVRVARFAGSEPLAEQLSFGNHLWARDAHGENEIRPLPGSSLAISAAAASFGAVAAASDRLH